MVDCGLIYFNDVFVAFADVGDDVMLYVSISLSWWYPV